jgi:two-component system, response regulator PdtaR
MQDDADLSRPGRSFSVLVAEDEVLIAMDLETMLEQNGHRIVGPANSVDAALRLLRDERPDVAVLDVNLRGQPVTPVAERLRSLHVPFVLASAYSSPDFAGAGALAGAENVRKPINERHLVEALGRVVRAAH